VSSGISGVVSPVRPAARLRPGHAGCAARSLPAVRRVAVADELIVLLLRGACPLTGAFQQLREETGQVGSGVRGARKTSSLDRLARPSPSANKT
jgi:hypothetical protein